MQILSKDEFINTDNEIIIINSYGVISDYLESCKSVFIGKSMLKKLKHVSGQDPIEAAKLNCKIYHGPFVSNFEEIYELLNFILKESSPTRNLTSLFAIKYLGISKDES